MTSPFSFEASPQKPTLVLVPGSFSGESLYISLLDLLASHGFPVIFASLPTVRPKHLNESELGPPASMQDDAAYIRSVVTKLVNDGKDVILVSHSYGGVPMTESTEGLGKAERIYAAKNGGIIGLIYIASFVPFCGESVAAITGDLRKDDNVISDGEFLSLDTTATASSTYSDLSREEGLAWVAKMEKHSARSFQDCTTYEAWRFIPATYVFCYYDQTLPLWLQRSMVKKIKMAGIEVKTAYCGTGHCPNSTERGRAAILKAVMETVDVGSLDLVFRY